MDGVVKILGWGILLIALLSFFGLGNIFQTGNNIGTGMRIASESFVPEGERTTGPIRLPSALYEKTLVALGSEYRRVTILNGTCLNTGSRSKIDAKLVGATASDTAYNELRSATGREERVLLWRQPAGSCS